MILKREKRVTSRPNKRKRWHRHGRLEVDRRGGKTTDKHHELAKDDTKTDEETKLTPDKTIKPWKKRVEKKVPWKELPEESNSVEEVPLEEPDALMT